MKSSIIALVLALLPYQAFAGFRTGNHLRNDLQNTTSAFTSGFGMGYVIGVADAFHGVGWCSPRHITVGQAEKITLSYLEKHPEKWHFEASFLIFEALAQAFPCKK